MSETYLKMAAVLAVTLCVEVWVGTIAAMFDPEVHTGVMVICGILSFSVALCLGLAAKHKRREQDQRAAMTPEQRAIHDLIQLSKSRRKKP